MQSFQLFNKDEKMSLRLSGASLSESRDILETYKAK